jgi:serine/threonine-protein kinase HipA
MQELGLDRDAMKQQFRRMVFNIVARNQDDHVKNIAFLMDRKGQWTLSPAFDVTYSFNPDGDWTSKHQMTLNGKKEGFRICDFESCGELVRLKQGEAKAIISEIQAVVSKWRDYADEVGVQPAKRDNIHHMLRLESFS